MKVYSIYLSEDGQEIYYATNSKSLFELIEFTEYNPTIIQYLDDDNKYRVVKYNYSNLNLAVKNKRCVTAINEIKKCNVRINELIKFNNQLKQTT